jgi:hypothetical protein
VFFCIRRVYRGSIFFSLVLILRICAYLGIKGDHFFSDTRFFFGARFIYKLVYYNLYHLSDLCKIVQFLCKIECIKFVYNKFVLVTNHDALVAVDIDKVSHRMEIIDRMQVGERVDGALTFDYQGGGSWG